MGIRYVQARRIVEIVGSQKLNGRMVMLGRQDWKPTSRPRPSEIFQKKVHQYYPDLSIEELRGKDGFAENFFQKIGFDQVDSIDFSDFEGASIVADLGGQIPEEYHGQFDFVYDGGTCEHVFELANAYRNIDRLLKPGGVFMAHSPSNNFVTHGFFQISPEVVYGFWVKAMGYEALTVKLIPSKLRNIGQEYGVSNPLESNRRMVMRRRPAPGMPLLLDYAVRKPLDGSTSHNRAMQSDYVVRWEKFNQKNDDEESKAGS